MSRLCRHWSGVPGPYGPWGLSTIEKIIMEKEHMASKVVKVNVRPIKAVGCVFKVVSLYCRRSISDNISKRKDEGVGKTEIFSIFVFVCRSTFCFLLIRPHQQPRLVSFVVHISLLTVRRHFFSTIDPLLLCFTMTVNSLCHKHIT